MSWRTSLQGGSCSTSNTGDFKFNYHHIIFLVFSFVFFFHHRLISTIQCSTDLETKYSANNDTSCSLCHHGKMPVYQLLPSTAHPGIRLNVSLLSLMGLGSTKTLEIRMHCLLLLPPTNFCPRHVVFPRLLASSALISPVSMLAGDSKEQKKMRLDILLPLAWKYNALVEVR